MAAKQLFKPAVEIFWEPLSVTFLSFYGVFVSNQVCEAVNVMSTIDVGKTGSRRGSP